MKEFLIEHEAARALLLLLIVIFLTEVVLHQPFRRFLAWAYARTNPSGKDYRWAALLGVSVIAASFGSTQLGLFGFGMTYATSYYTGAIILTYAFVLQNNLPGFKLETLLIVAGIVFGFIVPEKPMLNDMSSGLWVRFFGVLGITIIAFQLVYLAVTRLNLDERLQQWSLRLPESLANAIGSIGTCAIVTGFVMSQMPQPWGLHPGLLFTLLNTLGSFGWAIILMRIKKVDNLSLEAVFIGFGLAGLILML